MRSAKEFEYVPAVMEVMIALATLNIASPFSVFATVTASPEEPSDSCNQIEPVSGHIVIQNGAYDLKL